MSDATTIEADVTSLGEAAKPTTPKRAEARWRELIAQQQASGLSVARFCREHRVPESSLFAWRRRLGGAGQASQAGSRPRRRTKQAKPAAAEAFVEVKAVKPAAAAPALASGIEGEAELVVILGGGRRVLVRRPGFDRQLLAEVVAALEALP